MRTVFLLRHAKSDWSSGAATDHDRPLNARGHDACARLAAYFADHPLAPDAILCSDAVRTRETLERLRPSLGGTPTVEVDSRLYLASPETLMAALARQDDAHGRVMLVGHNPGIQTLALLLARPKKDGDYARMDEKYPTGGFARIDLDIPSWSDVVPGVGKLRQFLVPRSLPELMED